MEKKAKEGAYQHKGVSRKRRRNGNNSKPRAGCLYYLYLFFTLGSFESNVRRVVAAYNPRLSMDIPTLAASLLSSEAKLWQW